MRRVRGTAAACLLAVLVLAGCGRSLEPAGSSQNNLTAAGAPAAGGAQSVPHPGPLRADVVTAELMLWRSDTIPARVLKKIRAVPGVGANVQFSLAQVRSQDRPITFAAVDPGAFRRFAVKQTARTQPLWNRIADGEVALRSTLRDSVPLAGDVVPLGGSLTAHVGYYTDELVVGSGIDAVVNSAWAGRLGMPPGNAVLLSVAADDTEAAVRKLKKLAGRDGAVEPLSASGSTSGRAVPAGGFAAAVGSFSYTINPDGSVNPDPRWISQYIRTERVPILGNVTCSKAMLPQLRAALAEIAASDLADEINPGEYGGCYVPRFIGSDPTRGLSLHTWGLAVDLNVPGNLRGTAGTMDPRIVQIFNRWGFAWGGTWRDPDPMHFELAQLMRVGR
ncbi:hypothetical protein ABIE44_002216 [Marmoricola sp. OAE513]|uniref:M15 family metallopeptidase n=1 Tax=Marmoricola sp. OAE513 TaxID=2817894 RepID=UPI001AE710D1